MLYTRKGDDGTTKTFDSKPGQRISKSSCNTEALGALDEVNSFIGLVKVKASKPDWKVLDETTVEILKWVQNGLFIIQAELAGADKTIDPCEILRMEKMIDTIEAELPPIKHFFISGGTEEAALFDISRTMVRRAERRVIAAIEIEGIKVSKDTLSFLNRLSSLLYALARFSNWKSGQKEESPWYDSEKRDISS